MMLVLLLASLLLLATLLLLVSLMLLMSVMSLLSLLLLQMSLSVTLLHGRGGAGVLCIKVKKMCFFRFVSHRSEPVKDAN
jgi:hypothetical protein